MAAQTSETHASKTLWPLLLLLLEISVTHVFLFNEPAHDSSRT